MKKIYTLALAALAAFALTGCENDNMDNIKDNTPAEGSKVVFTAGLDAIARTAPAAGGVTTWTADDTIGVWDGTNYVDATIDNISGSTITFSAEVDPAATSYVAVTPADAWNGVDGENVVLNFATTQSAGKQVVAVATFEKPATEGTFRNVNNLLRFTVKKAAVKWAKLTGNKGEKFGTAVSVAPATGEGTATGEAAELVVPITTGENFLALPQGVNLAEGFTITLYGDEALTDYQGEVCSKGAVTLARNQQRSLGTIDGWIDNWKLWEAGKSITIAGVEYSKTSTGINGELLQTNGADYNIGSKLDQKPGWVVTFLEFGTANTRGEVVVCSRYDNAPITFKVDRKFVLMMTNVSFKGVNFAFTDTFLSNTEHVFAGYNTDTVVERLHFDNCKFTIPSGWPNAANNNASKFLVSGAGKQAIESIKFVNSSFDFANTCTGTTFLLYMESMTKLNQLKEVVFSNNKVWRSGGSGGVVIYSGEKVPTSGVQATAFELNNNTFYNVAPYCFKAYTMGGFVAKNNIFCASSKPSGSHIMAYAKDTTEFPYTIESNVSDTNMGVYYFNPNSGAYKALGEFVTKSGSASTYLKTIDVEKGIFEQTEAYKDKGAQKLF